MSNNELKIVNDIKASYEERKVSKLDELKKFDSKVKLPAYIFAYVFGVIGALILGVGMCMAMKVIFVNFSLSLVFGVIIGLIGILMVSVNYFIFLKILRKRKDKYKKDIYALSEKILNENN